MRLSFLLMVCRRPNQSKYLGKKRAPFPVKPHDKAAVIIDIKREERNMFLLRHPYLTAEQSRGHVQHLKKNDDYIQFWKEKKAAYRKVPDILLENHLAHLRHGDAWDV